MGIEISVLLLTYNQEDTIARALDSILCQKTTASYEIIIADDCSVDNTGKICRKYEEQFPDIITYIRRKHNLGIIENYFDAFKRAKGIYIADCAGDDFWISDDRLQKLYEVLKHNPDVSLASGEWQSRNEKTGKIRKAYNAASPGTYSGRKFLIDILTNKILINLSSSLYRKKIVEELLEQQPEIINGNDFKYEDLQIVLACASKGKIEVIPSIVYCYSEGHESVSHPSSFEKSFSYSSKAKLQWNILRDFFINHPTISEKKELKRYSLKRGDHILAMAFNAGPNKKKETIENLDSWIEAGVKGLLYKLLMKNASIWRLGLRIKRVL